MPSNQGRDIDALIDIVSFDDIAEIARSATWPEVRNHPLSSTCECPVVETLCRLRELGYEITKVP